MSSTTTTTTEPRPDIPTISVVGELDDITEAANEADGWQR